ncbi:MAG TPA: hypothetical protein PK307_00040 [Spirochaetota bacterium]|nr:hypothetical protein [Spirochaetota bacterium]HOD13114.1 hypothetical protein [Spirochaetota bacterium]HQL80558.1 hypothetical protein [Spirochaetota bacterium]
MNWFVSKAVDLKDFLFSEKEWAGFTWLLKILSVYLAAGILLTLAYEHIPAMRRLEPFIIGASFPIYVLVFGLLSGVPAFNLCRTAAARFQTKGRAVFIILLIMALFCACVILPQIILPRLLPVFTSALVVLFIVIILLLGLLGILKFVLRDIIQVMNK